MRLAPGPRLRTAEETGIPGPAEPRISAEAASTAPPASIAGAWSWQADGDAFKETTPPRGVLFFKTDGDRLTGQSLAELPLDDPAQKLNSLIVAFPVTGRAEAGNGGKAVWHLEIRAETGESTTSQVTPANGRRERIDWQPSTGASERNGLRRPSAGRRGDRDDMSGCCGVSRWEGWEMDYRSQLHGNG